MDRRIRRSFQRRFISRCRDRDAHSTTGSDCTTQRHVTWPTCVCRRRLQTVVASLALQSPRSWLLVPWTRTSTGQRSFAVYDPRTWNRLPTALRSPLASFKRHLKTHSSVPALDSADCSCGCRLPSSHRRCCDCTASSAPSLQMSRLDSTITRI